MNMGSDYDMKDMSEFIIYKDRAMRLDAIVSAIDEWNLALDEQLIPEGKKDE